MINSTTPGFKPHRQNRLRTSSEYHHNTKDPVSGQERPMTQENRDRNVKLKLKGRHRSVLLVLWVRRTAARRLLPLLRGVVVHLRIPLLLGRLLLLILLLRLRLLELDTAEFVLLAHASHFDGLRALLQQVHCCTAALYKGQLSGWTYSTRKGWLPATAATPERSGCSCSAWSRRSRCCGASVRERRRPSTALVAGC